jgi:hypothetical protein
VLRSTNDITNTLLQYWDFSLTKTSQLTNSLPICFTEQCQPDPVRTYLRYIKMTNIGLYVRRDPIQPTLDYNGYGCRSLSSRCSNYNQLLFQRLKRGTIQYVESPPEGKPKTNIKEDPRIVTIHDIRGKKTRLDWTRRAFNLSAISARRRNF